ncbi:MAG: tetratricopeptide repeat protein [Gemmatimonadota bacterium]
MTPHDNRLHQWQEEVARDPGSDAFVPLADLYRVQGRADVAMRVCHRGLERQPEHVEGHYLLGLIYRETDDPTRSYDEWDIALGLDPGHRAARRAIAFLCLERGDTAEAERHLRRALADEPDDPRLRRALRQLAGGAGGAPVGSEYWEAATPLLEDAVDHFARETGVRFVLVIDLSGRILTQMGFARDFDLPGLASLAAGVHAASGEMARMLGEPRFSQLFQGAGEHQVFVGALEVPPGELLLATVFGSASTIGLVREVFREVAGRLVLADWPSLPASAGPETLDEGLSAGLVRAFEHGADATSAGAE